MNAGLQCVLPSGPFISESESNQTGAYLFVTVLQLKLHFVTLALVNITLRMNAHLTRPQPLATAHLIESYATGHRYFERIDLREAQLCQLYLSKSKLCWADFTGADLSQAHLNHADMTGAMMWRSRLHSTQFRWANFHQTVMIRCDAEGANFSGASLHRTDLRLSNLRTANLAGADLRGAKLCYSDLTGADLTGADLTGADLTGANLTEARIEAVCWQSTLLQRTQIDTNWALKAADKGSLLRQPAPPTPV